MAKVEIAGLGEIDEEDVRASITLRNTIGNWMKNPGARRKMLEAHRAADPKASIPELDQPDPVEAKVSPIAEEVAALKKQLADEKAEREKQEKLAAFDAKINDGFRRLREEERLTAEGETAVRKIMEEEGISNPIIAFDHLQRRHPPQAPVTPGGQGAWNFMETPPDDQIDLKRLIETKGQSESVTDKMVRETLADLRGQARR